MPAASPAELRHILACPCSHAKGDPYERIGKNIAMILRSARAAICAALGLAGLLLVSAAPPARAQEADLVVRVNRLENQVRQLSGQIEQLQFQNGKLQEQLTKFQQDVEYRFQEMKGGARPSAAPAFPRARSRRRQPGSSQAAEAQRRLRSRRPAHSARRATHARQPGSRRRARCQRRQRRHRIPDRR
jgi:TolA-binding protein